MPLTSVPLEVVSDTLGDASTRGTMDVYGDLLAPSPMHAAEAMRRALWLDELHDNEPLATTLATNATPDDDLDPLNSDFVGRPGLDPGTLGLKVQFRALPAVPHCRSVYPKCRLRLVLVRSAETAGHALRKKGTQLLGPVGTVPRLQPSLIPVGFGRLVGSGFTTRRPLRCRCQGRPQAARRGRLDCGDSHRIME